MCAAAAAAAVSHVKPVLHNATTVAGQPVLLNCVMPLTLIENDILWLHPPHGLPVPVHAANTDMTDDARGPAARFVVVGNTTGGQHHLLIRYTVFPDDSGLWTCASISDSRLVQQTHLTLLVPPPTQVNLLQVSSAAIVCQ